MIIALVLFWVFPFYAAQYEQIKPPILKYQDVREAIIDNDEKIINSYAQQQDHFDNKKGIELLQLAGVNNNSYAAGKLLETGLSLQKATEETRRDLCVSACAHGNVKLLQLLHTHMGSLPSPDAPLRNMISVYPAIVNFQEQRKCLQYLLYHTGLQILDAKYTRYHKIYRPKGCTCQYCRHSFLLGRRSSDELRYSEGISDIYKKQYRQDIIFKNDITEHCIRLIMYQHTPTKAFANISKDQGFFPDFVKLVIEYAQDPVPSEPSECQLDKYDDSEPGECQPEPYRYPENQNNKKRTKWPWSSGQDGDVNHYSDPRLE